MAASKNLTPEQRSLRASIAAHAQWANEPNRTARMAAARKAAEARFDRQVDPDGTLPPDERARRAAHARRAHMRALALRSARLRRQGGCS
jgi:hypothetical protein